MIPEERIGPDDGIGFWRAPKTDDSAEGYVYDDYSPADSCKHDYEFKYMKEKVTEDGRIITLDHYHCRRCLEEKVKEK